MGQQVGEACGVVLQLVSRFCLGSSGHQAAWRNGAVVACGAWRRRATGAGAAQRPAGGSGVAAPRPGSVLLLRSGQRGGFAAGAGGGCPFAGASLVPVWGFGENNLYENMAVGHPWIQKWQRRIQRVLTFAPLMVQGRGVFSYSSGLVPHRRPISVVVGAPVDVGPADPQPSREKVQAVHKRYKEAVLELFETYRDIYDPKAADIVMV